MLFNINRKDLSPRLRLGSVLVLYLFLVIILIRAQDWIKQLSRRAPTGLKPAPVTRQDHAHNGQTNGTAGMHCYVRKVESNNWAVRPPQVWSLRPSPDRIMHTMVKRMHIHKRERQKCIVTCARLNRTTGPSGPHRFEACARHQTGSCTLGSYKKSKRITRKYAGVSC